MSQPEVPGLDEADAVVPSVVVVGRAVRSGRRRRGQGAPVVGLVTPARSPVTQGDDDHVALLHDPELDPQHQDPFGSCQITSSFGDNVGISWYKAVFLIVNAALGAGLLNFPLAFHEAGGLVSGNLVHVVFTTCALGSLIIIGKCASERNSRTYQEMVLQMCGPGWGTVASVCISVYCFITCVTFIIIIGDQFDRVFASYVGPDFCHHWYYDRRFTMTASSLLLIFPCCFKRIDGLRFMSYVGVVAIWYLVGVIVEEYYRGDYASGTVLVFDLDWARVFDVVPTICFGYQCHVSSIPIYSCLKNQDSATFSKACSVAVAVCLLVYTLSANYGYLTFGNLVNGDVLLSYDATKPQVLVADILLAIKSWTTYPILLFCVREAMCDLYVQMRYLIPEEAALTEGLRRKVVAVVLWAASILLAVFTPSINVVVKMLGSLASVFIFIFPGMCLLQLVFQSRGVDEEPEGLWRDRGLVLVAAAYIVVGTFSLGLAFTLGVQHILHPDLVQPLCH